MVRFVRWALALWALVWLFVARTASAHAASDTYLTLAFPSVARGVTLDGRLDMPLSDLDGALAFPRSVDGAISARAVRGRQDSIVALAFDHLGVTADAARCALVARDFKFTDHEDGVYVALLFTAECPAPPRALDLDYSLFLDQPGQEHRGLARVVDGTTSRSIIFSSGFRHERVERTLPSVVSELTSAIRGGVEHIASGIDHLLFLLALLLPAVLRREGATWTPVATFRAAAVEVAKIVTAFTVAHSITLSLSALDVVRLSPRFVEPAIAASVVFAAAQNLARPASHGRWRVAFVLGLLHGFGFSSALVDLGLARTDFLVTLFGFNVGVEVGQLTVVAVFLPVAYACRTSRFYRPVALMGGSAAIAAVASVWFVQRAFFGL